MVRPLVVFCLFAGLALAGCLGGDDSINGDGAGGAGEPAEGMGSIEGRVLTEDLDEVAAANVALVADADLVKEARTGEDGRYALENVEPGEYRLQITAPCCREHVQGIEVVEGETAVVDVQLVRFTAGDLKQPYVQEFEWTGMLSCSFSANVIAWDPCEAADPEASRIHPFELEPGLETVTAAMVWSSPGVLGNELAMALSQRPCESPASCNAGTDYYEYVAGESPVYMRSDGGGGPSFDGIEETADVMWRIFPPFGTVEVYYQQEFTVYWHMHYHAPAPEDHDPLPDI